MNTVVCLKVCSWHINERLLRNAIKHLSSKANLKAANSRFHRKQNIICSFQKLLIFFAKCMTKQTVKTINSNREKRLLHTFTPAFLKAGETKKEFEIFTEKNLLR